MSHTEQPIADRLDNLAVEIGTVADAARSIAGSKLKQKCVLILLQNMTGLAQKDIRAVLEAASRMDKEFLK